MRRALSLFLFAGLLLACSDVNVPSDPDIPDATSEILDGTTGDLGDDVDLQANEFFYWLAPMVDQPDESQFGTFNPNASPTVRVICLQSGVSSAGCDPTDGDPEIVDTFTVGDGLIVEADHYKVDFDTQAYQLHTSSDSDFTTYRIEVLTPPLELFGGPFVIGLADFELGENGREARNLDNSATIGLVDDRTLPIRFRLDEGALEEELAVNTAPTDDPTGDRAFCQINCSVTVIDVDQDTEASLFDPGTGDELSAILIPANTVWTTLTEADEGAVVHVIDELVDDGDTESGELCLPFGELPTEACYRHELSPDNTDPNINDGNDFVENAENELPRAGVCPTSDDLALVSGGAALPTWRFLKADEVNGTVEITRPPEVSVSDFLTCDVDNTVALWDGPGGQLAGAVLNWLVSPLHASDFWGGQLRDLSDLFMGEDVEMTALTFPSSAGAGTTLQMTVQLTAVHDGTTTLSGRTVTFTITEGSGSLTDPDGNVTASNGSITLQTDTDGQATVDWEITEGANRLEATSPHAEAANADADVLTFDAGEPLVFEVTGTAAAIGAWTSSGTLADARRDHTATVLDNGDVLIVAGTGAGAELWSAADGTFSSVPTQFDHGQGTAATKLADSRVLVTGGNGAPRSAEIFDPSTGTFTALNTQLLAARSYHSSTLLTDGTVLITGGQQSTMDGPQTITSVEIFDPTDDSFTSAGSLTDDRSGHAAALLEDGSGRVLVLGGTQTTTPGSGIALNTAELYDPQGPTFSGTDDLGDARSNPGAVVLGSGEVLVTGGSGLTSAELYDPTVGTFSPTGNTSSPHAAGTLTLLSDGRALIAGGFVATGPVTTNEAEVYDPTVGTWSAAADMIDLRQQHTATLLSDGRVLAVGGFSSGAESDLATSELFSVPPMIE